MIFRVLAVLNEFERDQVSERTAAVLQHKKAKLEAYSPTPYGYTRKGSRLVPHVIEQDIIRRIQNLRESGNSLREIAAVLNDEGVSTKNNGAWHASTVRYILRNDLYDVNSDS